MKFELKDRDINLLDRVGEKTETDYLWDTKDGYIEIEYIWNALSDLENKYIELEEKIETLKNKESVSEHFMSESFNKGFHPDEY